MGAIERSDSGDHIFADSFCVLIAFEMEFKSKEQFRFDDFARATGWKDKRRFRNTCSSKYRSSDYHLHLRWRIMPPEAVTVTMEFVKGYKAPDEDEREPLAEDFIEWLKQFIVVKELSVDLYSDFVYPHDPNRQLRFPLPMRAPIGPQQAVVEIDGISFKLSPPVEGVAKVWVTQSEKEVDVHLHAEKVIEIASLAPRPQALELSKVLESLFERQESKDKRQ